MSRQQAVDDVDQPVQREQPHRREMPLESPGKPPAKRDCARKAERKKRRSVIDLPAACHHDEDGEDVDPVSDAHDEGMNLDPAAVCRLLHAYFLRHVVLEPLSSSTMPLSSSSLRMSSAALKSLRALACWRAAMRSSIHASESVASPCMNFC